METKIFELRDRATFIPVIAIKMDAGSNIEQRYLLRRAGYSQPISGCVLFGRADGKSPIVYDYWHWKDRTYKTAHHHVINNFDDMKDGEVIDVEFILGETTEKKQTERFDYKTAQGE